VTRPTIRYRYQEILWGGEAQRRLGASRVAVFGVGGTGAACAEVLARAGVGVLRLIDRDVVEVSDLHRTLLYDAHDAANPIPKVEAAARRIAALNADVKVEAVMAYVVADNAKALAEDADVIVDGSDNFLLRLILNDVAVATGRPMVYQGAVAERGAVMAVVPGSGPCLRCLITDEVIGLGVPTCSQIGVSPGVVAATGGWGAEVTLALLRGQPENVAGRLTSFSAGRAVTLRVERRPDCPACGRGEYDFLGGRYNPDVGVVCGGCAFEVFPRYRGKILLSEIGARLAHKYKVSMGDKVLSVIVNAGVSAVLMEDGRALVYGPASAQEAETIYRRVFGL